MIILIKIEGYLAFISNKYKFSVLNRWSMKILVDADACPVKDIILEISEKYNIEAIFVCSLSHYSNYYEKHGLNPVYVDNVSQSADLAIINRAREGDIVVTGDYGLAAIILSKGAFAVSFDGKLFDDNNIDELLAKRHETLKSLRGGGRVKGPAKRSAKDDEEFLCSLERLIKII